MPLSRDEPLHLLAAQRVFQPLGAEPAEQALGYVVVAPAGVHAQPAFHRPQRGLHGLRVVDAFHRVVKNIARDEDDIRVLRVDLFHHVGDALRADAVAQMQIRNQHHAQAVAPAAILVGLHSIMLHRQLGCVVNPHQAGQDDAEPYRAAEDQLGVSASAR